MTGDKLANELNGHLPISALDLTGNNIATDQRMEIISSWERNRFDSTTQNNGATFVLYGEPNGTVWM